MKPRNIFLLIIVAAVIATLGYLVFREHAGKTLPGTPTMYEAQLAACGAYPNNSTQDVTETSRLTIHLPRALYAKGNTPLSFRTASGTATAGWISNAGPMSNSYGATTDCAAYYYEFEGDGEVDLVAASSVENTPDYLVHFIVHPTP